MDKEEEGRAMSSTDGTEREEGCGGDAGKHGDEYKMLSPRRQGVSI